MLYYVLEILDLVSSPKVQLSGSPCGLVLYYGVGNRGWTYSPQEPARLDNNLDEAMTSI